MVHQCRTNVWSELLVCTLPLRLQQYQWSWLVHWCRTNVQPVVLAYTLALGLQIYQWSWMVHQCRTEVWPALLAGTLRLRLQTYQQSLLVHQYMISPAGSYIGIEIKKPPVKPAHTLVSGQCTTSCQHLHQHWGSKIPMRLVNTSMYDRYTTGTIGMYIDIAVTKLH